jgi:hypothetical protein
MKTFILLYKTWSRMLTLMYLNDSLSSRQASYKERAMDATNQQNAKPNASSMSSILSPFTPSSNPNESNK